MKSELQNVKLAFTCRENWDEMAAVDGGRFCNACNKKIYDFTDTKVQQFLQILAENDNQICGKFRANQTQPSYKHASIWTKLLSATLVFIGINACDRPKMGKYMPPHNKANSETVCTTTLGIPIMPQAEFPGGKDSLSKFLQQHIRYYKTDMQGKVIASFTIKADGSLSGIKIIKSLNKKSDREVIRALKLSPKWIPAKIGNRFIEMQFTLPVSFENGHIK